MCVRVTLQLTAWERKKDVSVRATPAGDAATSEALESCGVCGLMKCVVCGFTSTQFIRMLDVLEAYVQEVFGAGSYQRADGSKNPEQRQVTCDPTHRTQRL